MSAINSQKFQEICSDVWRDRAAVLTGQGSLSGEAALLRAVYWRLCKSGLSPATSDLDSRSLQTISDYHIAVNGLLEINGASRFDSATFLEDLMQRYDREFSHSS
ncbi:MAG: hypothetical protein ABR555_09995 [Pyrinomonadaceae bacterium]